MVDPTQADILVVDDTTTHLTILSDILSTEGYRVRGVPSGQIALQAVAARGPDLILLDIGMPEMDGIELCTRLKGHPDTAAIPVIFITAKTDDDAKARAFAAGAIDYVTKPFEASEVVARVATHVRQALLSRKLLERNDELVRMHEMQDGLVHLIVHDLRSPLSAILMSLQLLEMTQTGLDESGMDDVQRAIRSTNALVRMVSSLLSVREMEAGVLELDCAEHSLVEIIHEAVGLVTTSESQKRVALPDPGMEVMVAVDRELLLRTIENLVGNALRHTAAESPIEVTVAVDVGHVQVSVSDKGPGVPPEHRERIFEKFGQVEARKAGARVSTGLGLAFCQMAIGAHGGAIGVESTVGEGSTFWFRLPLGATHA